MLYRVNVLEEVFVLAMELRQLFDAEEPEMLEAARPLRMLVGEAARRDCGWGSPLARAGDPTTIGDTGEGGDGNGGDVGEEDESNPIIRFATRVVRVEPWFEIECEL